jgi:hypothetical protein
VVEPDLLALARALAVGARTRRKGANRTCEAVRPERRFVVYGGAERFPLAEGVEALSVIALCAELSSAAPRN